MPRPDTPSGAPGVHLRRIPALATVLLLLSALAAGPAFGWTSGHLLVTTPGFVDDPQYQGGVITEYDLDRVPVRTLGAYQLQDPVKMALHPAGFLCVSDGYAGNLKKFDTFGNLVGTVGDGHLVAAGGVAAGPDGRIYVGDRIQGDIRVFDADGDFLESFGGDILLDAVEVRVTAENLVIVGDGSAGYIRVFDAAHDLISSIKLKFSGALAVDASNLIYVPDLLEVVKKFDLDGDLVETVPLYRSVLASGVEVDGDGNIVLVDFLSGKIETHGPDGTLLEEGAGAPRDYPNDILVIP